jgi:hypothetical protein
MRSVRPRIPIRTDTRFSLGRRTDRIRAAVDDRAYFPTRRERYRLNDWSFSQLCKLAGVSKDTVNKVSADTAGRVLAETLPQGGKPMQVLTLDRAIRSIHGASYTRLHNLDLLAIVKEFATDFQPPQTGMNGATGLYCGEQKHVRLGNNSEFPKNETFGTRTTISLIDSCRGVMIR